MRNGGVGRGHRFAGWRDDPTGVLLSLPMWIRLSIGLATLEITR